jgi:hypothetical protein
VCFRLGIGMFALSLLEQSLAGIRDTVTKLRPMIA